MSPRRENMRREAIAGIAALDQMLAGLNDKDEAVIEEARATLIDIVADGNALQLYLLLSMVKAIAEKVVQA
jgi:hypothetical protein